MAPQHPKDRKFKTWFPTVPRATCAPHTHLEGAVCFPNHTRWVVMGTRAAAAPTAGDFEWGFLGAPRDEGSEESRPPSPPPLLAHRPLCTMAVPSVLPSALSAVSQEGSRGLMTGIAWGDGMGAAASVLVDVASGRGAHLKIH